MFTDKLLENDADKLQPKQQQKKQMVILGICFIHSDMKVEIKISCLNDIDSNLCGNSQQLDSEKSSSSVR